MDNINIIPIIEETFRRIDEVYKTNKEPKESNKNTLFSSAESRLCFPKYSEKNKTNPNAPRVSEQELRFIFTEVFNYHCKKNNFNYYYSIETPTINPYIFSKQNSDNKQKKVPRIDPENGRSARFDFVIYDSSGKKICLIEFKGDDDKKNYIKDFFKLSEEGVNIPCYVIDLFESSDSGTRNKIKNRFEDSCFTEHINNTIYIGHSIKISGGGFKTIYYSSTQLTNIPKDWKSTKDLKESK